MRDKHQTIFLNASYLGGIKGAFSCDHPFQLSREPFGPLEKGVHFATFPAKAKFEHNLQITFGVTFADIDGVMEGQPVPAVLHQLVDLAERIIAIFERRFFQ